ncbi:MAG: saccharopine dehydrogenase C-terminal domain-containing protein [Bacteroidia bacterium]
MVQKKILIFGAGRIGRAIALDIAEHYSVTVVDASAPQLMRLREQNAQIQIRQANFLEIQTLRREIAEAALILTAVPGRLGYQVLQELIEAGKPVVDISFFAEDPYSLEAAAQKHGATIVVDAGIAPGLSNFILGYELTQRRVESFICYVGGLPVERSWPFQYKATFSPEDVIEEYTRPVRQRIGGRLVTKPPLSDVELIQIEGIGILEAFNTDGLRTLLRNTDVPTLIEKTLRYPGHVEYIQILAHAGFFSESPIEVNGYSISPRQVTMHLLREVWAMKPDDKDFVVMRLDIHSQDAAVQYTIIDYADEAKQLSAMARTTAYTCTAIASWLLAHSDELPPGVYAPEQIAEKKTAFSFVMQYLRERGIKIARTDNLLA